MQGDFAENITLHEDQLMQYNMLSCDENKTFDSSRSKWNICLAIEMGDNTTFFVVHPTI